MWPLAVPLVSLVGGLLSSVVGSVLSKELSESTMQTQAKINQQGIDTANRYSLPINQVQRLRDAGLNPNLVYGNGSVQGITSQGAASTNQGLKNMPFSLGLESAAQSYLQSKQIDQSIQESKSRQLEINQRIRESMERTTAYGIQNAFDRDLYNTRKHQLQRMDTMIEKDLELKSRQAEYYGTMSSINREKIGEIQEQVKYISAKTGLTEEQTRSEIARRSLWNEQIKEIQSRCDLNDAQMRFIEEKILNVRQDTDNKKLWHELQEINRDSNHAFDKFLSEHENIAIIVGVLRELSRFMGGSVTGNGWSLSF